MVFGIYFRREKGFADTLVLCLTLTKNIVRKKKKLYLFTVVIKIIKHVLIENHFHKERNFMQVNLFHMGKIEKVKRQVR